MKTNFNSTLKKLKTVINKFDSESLTLQQQALSELSGSKLQVNKALLDYHECLLFMCSHPNNKQILEVVEKELSRITLFLKKSSKTAASFFENEGLPYSHTVTRFTPDFLKWLSTHSDVSLQFSAFSDPTLTLNEVLNLTLPSALKSHTTAGLEGEELLEVLGVSPKEYLFYLVNQIERLNEHPLIKDFLFERLEVYVKLIPKNASFSRTYNRTKIKQPFFHDSLLKKFDHEALLNAKLPADRMMDVKERAALIDVLKNAMALTARETDPTTFIEPSSLKVFDLERGMSVCIYGMVPDRQLPFESYVGFTLLKNGFPCSYGGAWVFGKGANFGMNILESFRGGESGYVMCQLLRVYKQAFNLSYFEIEAYQFGLDNPDGITSGAFWFYYRYGFRPLDKNLLKLSNSEFSKIQTKKNYRSTEKVLLKFTESNVALNMEKKTPVRVVDITEKIRVMINKRYKNDATLAEKKSVELFLEKTKQSLPKSRDEKAILNEVALWVNAFEISDPQN
ncbi:MAG: hypothetical protein IPP64_15560 [Bacteroidetes bacterium]|nr:hypothetical protein [Bacteroidota bacterium]